jgi:hypothetical protein
VADRRAGVVYDDVLGPIDYLAVEFPGRHVTGEGFELLLDLVERGIIRVLDVEHGGDVDLTMWQGASSGLLDQSDVDHVASAIEPGSLAGILVYENVWAVPLMAAWDRSATRLVGSGRIVVDDLLTAPTATETT